MTGGEGDAGSISAGLFGAVNVEPAGSVWYRSQVTRDDLNLARTDKFDNTVDSFPRIDYAAVYPNTHRYAGLPVLGMLKGNEIVHSDLTAIIAGPSGSGYLIPNVASTRTYPNRNQPFREFTIIFHDETGAVQAFPQFESDDFNFTLHSVRDSFAINYGSGGAGAEILANRVGVGPARDCPECMYEEFFLSSWALGDPAMVVDKPANAPCTRGPEERSHRSPGAGLQLARSGRIRPQRRLLGSVVRPHGDPVRAHLRPKLGGRAGAPAAQPGHPSRAAHPARQRGR